MATDHAEMLLDSYPARSDAHMSSRQVSRTNQEVAPPVIFIHLSFAMFELVFTEMDTA